MSTFSDFSMSDLLVISAFLSFVFFFIAGRYRKYPAIAGWTCIILNLLSELPAYFREGNFLYPLIALLSVPFLAITVERLLCEDEIVLQLSRAAAIATLVWVPFALIPALGDRLISGVVMYSFALITALGHQPKMLAWDIFFENGFANQIILGCTGITAMAMMTGFVFSEKSLTIRQAASAILLIVPLIFVLNLFRVAVVFIAVSDRWFDAFPDPTGTGDPNFFWAHNVCAEGLAVLFLLLLTKVLFRFIPALWIFVRTLGRIYRDHLSGPAGADTC